ncbi:MAG: hypothetical protein C4318_03935 [Acidimicrobiia bacterium]
MTQASGDCSRLEKLQLLSPVPRWTTLLALTGTATAGFSLMWPRWRLVGPLGGNPIYSKRSIEFAPGIIEAIFLVVAAGACISLLKHPANPGWRSAGAIAALCGAFVSSLELATIPREAIGYSLSPTPPVRAGSLAIIVGIITLLVPYTRALQHRVMSPEERMGSPHPIRAHPPPELNLEEDEPG